MYVVSIPYRTVKYYMSGCFEDDWIEISEKQFNDLVVKYRHFYTIRYIDCNTTVFSDVDTGIDSFKRVYLPK